MKTKTIDWTMGSKVMLTWIIENKEWAFSGIGLLIINVLLRCFRQTKKCRSGKRIKIIQNVKGNKNVQTGIRNIVSSADREKNQINVEQNLLKGENNTQVGVQVNHIDNYIFVLPEFDQLHIAGKVKEVCSKPSSVGEYTWISEDKKILFFINESGYCKQTGFFIVEPRTLVSITFPYPFENTDYSFFIEPFNISIENIKKTTTGVSFIIGHKDYPSELLSVRWLAVGVCG